MACPRVAHVAAQAGTPDRAGRIHRLCDQRPHEPRLGRRGPGPPAPPALRVALPAHNVVTALKRLALPLELLTAQPQRLRVLVITVPGRLIPPAR
ncbi:MAG: hypothetical protein NNA22_09100 [Nitrospira sp.]|nr:hypothetical protein [Nitrospira sp.]